MYDLADEMCVLPYSDSSVVTTCIYFISLRFIGSVYHDAAYQVRRVDHHPSLAHWAGGNGLENGLLLILRTSPPDDYPRLQADYEKLSTLR